MRNSGGIVENFVHTCFVRNKAKSHEKAPQLWKSGRLLWKTDFSVLISRMDVFVGADALAQTAGSKEILEFCRSWR